MYENVEILGWILCVINFSRNRKWEIDEQGSNVHWIAEDITIETTEEGLSDHDTAEEV